MWFKRFPTPAERRAMALPFKEEERDIESEKREALRKKVLISDVADWVAATFEGIYSYSRIFPITVTIKERSIPEEEAIRRRAILPPEEDLWKEIIEEVRKRAAKQKLQVVAVFKTANYGNIENVRCIEFTFSEQPRPRFFRFFS